MWGSESEYQLQKRETHNSIIPPHGCNCTLTFDFTPNLASSRSTLNPQAHFECLNGSANKIILKHFIGMSGSSPVHSLKTKQTKVGPNAIKNKQNVSLVGNLKQKKYRPSK